MLRPRTLAARAVAAALLLAPAAVAAGPLKWSPRPGETLRYAFTQTFATKVSAAGHELTDRQEVHVDLTWKVVSVAPDGTVELSQTLDRARTKIDAPGMSLDYDSRDKKSAESPPAQIWARAYEAVLGKPYTIKLNPRGEVVDVAFPEESKAALAGSPFAAAADAATFFSAAGVKNLFAQLLPRLPEGDVARGATWDADLPLPTGPVTVDLKLKYTLAALEPATIDATLVATVIPGPEFKGTLKVNKQSGSARYLFDPAAGRLDSMASKQTVELAQSTGGREGVQTTETTMSFKLVK